MMTIYDLLEPGMQDVRRNLEAIRHPLPGDRVPVLNRFKRINSTLETMNQLCRQNNISLESYLERHGLELERDNWGDVKNIRILN